MERESEQIQTHSVSLASIMRCAAFAHGVADKRSGRPPRYDDFMFDQDEVAAKVKINGHWDYERGRQWASIAPPDLLLKVDGKLNPKALALYQAAGKRGYII